jgi:hypothetical protein
VVISGTGATFTTSWATAGIYTVTLTDSAMSTAAATVNVTGPPPMATRGTHIGGLARLR